MLGSSVCLSAAFHTREQPEEDDDVELKPLVIDYDIVTIDSVWFGLILIIFSFTFIIGTIICCVVCILTFTVYALHFNSLLDLFVLLLIKCIIMVDWLNE